MAVFLVGGGWSDEQAPVVFGGFLDAARSHAGGSDPRVLLVVMGTDAEAREYHEKYVAALALAGPHSLEIARVEEGSAFDGSFDGIDGLFVGGGPTPEYHASLAPSYAAIREVVAAGVAYLGFSAGSAIAATQAIIGGWLVDGVPVCPEESNEELDELTVVEGIGLVDGAVDVHAAQWGNLSRLVAAVESGRASHGIAIDECTTLEVGSGSVVGAGQVWRVSGELLVTRGPGH